MFTFITLLMTTLPECNWNSHYVIGFLFVNVLNNINTKRCNEKRKYCYHYEAWRD